MCALCSCLLSVPLQWRLVRCEYCHSVSPPVMLFGRNFWKPSQGAFASVCFHSHCGPDNVLHCLAGEKMVISNTRPRQIADLPQLSCNQSKSNRFRVCFGASPSASDYPVSCSKTTQQTSSKDGLQLSEVTSRGKNPNVKFCHRRALYVVNSTAAVAFASVKLG